MAKGVQSLATVAPGSSWIPLLNFVKSFVCVDKAHSSNRNKRERQQLFIQVANDHGPTLLFTKHVHEILLPFLFNKAVSIMNLGLGLDMDLLTEPRKRGMSIRRVEEFS